MGADTDGPVTVHAGGAPTLIVFCGLPGSGKTTLAEQLQAAGRGIRLCTDDWVAGLGVAPDGGEFHERLQTQLYRHALELLGHGVDVVLEDGLWTQAERAQKFADARALGARIEWHVFDVPLETLWTRLQRRNEEAAEGAYPMTRGELERAWSLFQPPTPEELAVVDTLQRHG